MTTRLPALIRAYQTGARVPRTGGRRSPLLAPAQGPRGPGAARRAAGLQAAAARRASRVGARRLDRRDAFARSRRRAADAARPLRPRDLRHANLGGPDRPPPAARSLAPVRAARRAALRPPLPRSLAARSGARRRIGDLAEHGRSSSIGGRSRSSSSMAASRIARSGAGSASRGRSVPFSGASPSASRKRRPMRNASRGSARTQVAVAGNLKFDAPPPPADPRALAQLAGVIAGRPVWLAASDPSGRGRCHRRRAQGARDAPSPPSDDHRSAPPASRAGDRRLVERAGLRAARRSEGVPPDRATRCLHGRYGRRAWAVLPPFASRLDGRLAGAARRTEPDRAGKAWRRHPARPPRSQLHRHLCRARPLARCACGQGRARRSPAPSASFWRTRR